MKPTIPEVLPLARAVYVKSSVGCCLHIVLDDGNVDNGSVAHCMEWAREQGHPDCLELAELLATMSKTQRRKLGRMVP